MTSIAERAGVSRQTVYRWWSTKAEILLEASAIDAAQELDIPDHPEPPIAVRMYLEALIEFLARSPAGAAYRALLGEAQHDRAVGALLAENDLLGRSAERVIARALPGAALGPSMPEAIAQLVGPVFFWVLAGHDPAVLDTHVLAAEFLRRASASGIRT